MEELGKITQEEALAAVMKYRKDEMLKLIEEAVSLKRQEDEANEEQLELPIEEEEKGEDND